MKRALVILAISMLFTTTANAASTVNGTSSGGTLGKTTVSGNVAAEKGVVGFIIDSASAKTTSISIGTVGAGVVMHYATTSSGDNTVSDYDIQNNALSANAWISATTNYGTYATGGHTYSSTQYGSWSGSTSQNF
ncbi:hypothetical protein [Paenibacillus cellulosilyticus]|uniref:hypothetical protein n=1 Tax=Paenibacillus cellulosilyticus TaxID=375489 RepID=UPI0011B3A576|nr:hypothetical protein [Paenibacillus cellulosilyticus]